jgi:hypothetical protein
LSIARATAELGCTGTKHTKEEPDLRGLKALLDALGFQLKIEAKAKY